MNIIKENICIEKFEILNDYKEKLNDDNYQFLLNVLDKYNVEEIMLIAEFIYTNQGKGKKTTIYSLRKFLS